MFGSTPRFAKQNTGRVEIVHGSRAENDMNDTPIYVGVKNNLGNPNLNN
jgi:hypothetical protein